jgi:hypothetical protein
MSEGIFPDLGGDDIAADSTVIPCPGDRVGSQKIGSRGNGLKTDAEIEKERAAELFKKNGADPRQLDQLSTVKTGVVTIEPIRPGAPALKGDPYHPDVVRDRVHLPYRANLAHDPKSPLFNSIKTPEPRDVTSVYQTSVRADIETWYGRSAYGKYYRYFSDNTGGAYYSGIVPRSRVPKEILKELGR